MLCLQSKGGLRTQQGKCKGLQKKMVVLPTSALISVIPQAHATLSNFRAERRRYGLGSGVCPRVCPLVWDADWCLQRDRGVCPINIFKAAHTMHNSSIHATSLFRPPRTSSSGMRCELVGTARGSSRRAPLCLCVNGVCPLRALALY